MSLDAEAELPAAGFMPAVNPAGAASMTKAEAMTMQPITAPRILKAWVTCIVWSIALAMIGMMIELPP